ncbi:MAG: PilN domain-containing protein [Desulfuromonadales bacterium]
MRYTINLVTRTHLDQRLVNKFAYGAITLLVLITGWNVSRVSSNMGEQNRLGAEIALIQNKLGARPSGISEADFSRQKTHIKFYNGIIDRKSLNWLSLLELIENATPEGISLSSLSPGKKQEDWKLEGHAKSFKFVQQYLEKLESSKNFSNVMLLSHQSLALGEKTHSVNFVISCKVTN